MHHSLGQTSTSAGVLLAAILLAPASLAAQNPDLLQPSKAGNKPRRAVVPPPERRSAAGYCSLLTNTRPSRLGPGQAGEIVLTLVLQRQGVIDPSAPFRVVYEENQDPLALGRWQRDAAPLARLSPHYLGQPLFEDTMLVRIPVTVRAGTDYGEYPVHFEVRARVCDGATGGALGVLKSQVVGKVRVGTPVPTPVVQSVAAGRGEVGDGERASPAATGDGGGTTPPPGVTAAVGLPVDPGTRALPELAGEGEMVARDDGRTVVWVMAGIGAAVIALLGLLALRGRRA